MALKELAVLSLPNKVCYCRCWAAARDLPGAWRLRVWWASRMGGNTALNFRCTAHCQVIITDTPLANVSQSSMAASIYFVRPREIIPSATILRRGTLDKYRAGSRWRCS